VVVMAVLVLQVVTVMLWSQMSSLTL